MFGDLLAAPPSLDLGTEFGPAIDAYANTLFDGLLGLLPVLLAVAAVFTLLGIAVRTIRRWIGTSSASGAMYGGDNVGDQVAKARAHGMAGYMNRHNRRRGNQWGHE